MASAPSTTETPNQSAAPAALPMPRGIRLRGSASGDSLAGGAGNDVLLGQGGPDILSGGLGDDLLEGDEGSDTLVGAAGRDTVAGGPGVDVARYGGAAGGYLLTPLGNGFHRVDDIDPADGDDGADTLFDVERVGFSDGVETALAAVEASAPRTGGPVSSWVFGTAAPETVRGGPGASNDELSPGSGVDTMIGGGGDDRYVVGAYGEAIVELPGEGTDTVLQWNTNPFFLPANVENLVLQGSAAMDANGNDLANWIVGNSARNLIEGRRGDDAMAGGSGADVFAFAPGWGNDRILDFTPGQDVARLSGTLSSFDAVAAAMAETEAGTVLRLPDGGGTLLFEGLRPGDLSERDFDLPVDMAAYAPSFADEFDAFSRMDGRNGDGGTWRTRIYHGTGHINANEDLQYYVDAGWNGLGVNPFSVRDGVLAISSAHRTDLKEQMGGREYTSGVITTQGTHAQQYGYFEARLQLPAGNGFFPAFWMLPVDEGWPPEIDILEAIGRRPDEVFQMGRYVKGLADTTQGFHTYGLEWTADKLAWYVDGVQTHVVRNHGIHEPMYMILNLGIGGAWAGGPQAGSGGATGGVGSMLVDYVRSYSAVDEPPLPGAAAPEAAFSVEPLAVGQRPADAFRYTADTAGKMTFSSDDLGFPSAPDWATVAVDNDRAADAYTARASSWGYIRNASVADADGGTVRLENFAMSEVVLGGGADSRVTLVRPQYGLVETGSGNDEVRITEGRNWLAGLPASAAVRTGEGDDLIEGWAGRGWIELDADGGAGSDTLRGSADPDTLRGGDGSDLLSGGAMADVFVFGAGEAGRDTVADFDASLDRLRFSGVAPEAVSAVDTADGLLLSLPGGAEVLLVGVPAGGFDWGVAEFV